MIVAMTIIVYKNNNYVDHQVDTEDVEEFGRATAGLKFESFDGGRDSRERMTQVNIFFA